MSERIAESKTHEYPGNIDEKDDCFEGCRFIDWSSQRKPARRGNNVE